MEAIPKYDKDVPFPTTCEETETIQHIANITHTHTVKDDMYKCITKYWSEEVI